MMWGLGEKKRHRDLMLCSGELKRRVPDIMVGLR